MKKLFALALVVCMFAVSNVFAVDDNANVNVTVIDQVTMQANSGNLSFVVVKGSIYGTGSGEIAFNGVNAPDGTAITYNASGEAGYNVTITWGLTLTQTNGPDLTFDKNNGQTESGVLTGGTISPVLTVTQIDATNATTGGPYTYTQNCTVVYTDL